MALCVRLPGAGAARRGGGGEGRRARPARRLGALGPRPGRVKPAGPARRPWRYSPGPGPAAGERGRRVPAARGGGAEAPRVRPAVGAGGGGGGQSGDRRRRRMRPDRGRPEPAAAPGVGGGRRPAAARDRRAPPRRRRQNGGVGATPPTESPCAAGRAGPGRNEAVALRWRPGEAQRKLAHPRTSPVGEGRNE